MTPLREGWILEIIRPGLAEPDLFRIRAGPLS